MNIPSFVNIPEFIPKNSKIGVFLRNGRSHTIDVAVEMYGF